MYPSLGFAKMFWRMAGLSTTSPVESLLEREHFTLEELFDEEEIIQECKSVNSRLINFLRGRAQVQQMLRYVVEEPPEEADSRRTFKFPFIACEIFSCEIDVILKTLVEDEELMDLLFSFLDPDRAHSALLAGYFSKVVVCLMLRKTGPLIEYVQAHQGIFRKLVDLIGITSIMEVLIRLVGVDDHMFTSYIDAMQWLADTDLLDLIVDKLSYPSPPEVHTNAAETLCAITRSAPSALATKLSSPSFVGRLFHHALEDAQSKSSLVYSLSVCISVLDPKRSAAMGGGAGRGHHIPESVFAANPETVDGMLQRLGDLLKLLDVSSSETVLPTTYGQLQPPLGKHRLKIVEFIAVLLRTGSEVAQAELVRLGAIQTIIKLFFDYTFNNALHHQVESIIISCLESNNATLIEHLLQDCNLVGRILAADENPIVSCDENKPTVPAPGRVPPKAGYVGHLTRIANKLCHLAANNHYLQAFLQENQKWMDWETTVLSSRNSVENVYQWACGRPTTVHERTMDSDEDDFRDRDYDVSTMASNLSQAFRYGMFDNEDGEEGHGVIDRDDEDVFFDDESAEMVVSSIKIAEEQDSGGLREAMFTNANWFAFQEDRPTEQSVATSLVSSSPRIDDSQVNNTATSANSGGGSSSSDDEVVVGEDEDLVDTDTSQNACATNFGNGTIPNGETVDLEMKGKDSLHLLDDLSLGLEKVGITDNFPFIQCEERTAEIFGVKPPDWVGWRETADFEGTSGRNPFRGSNPFDTDLENLLNTGNDSKSAVANHNSGLEMDGVSGKKLNLEGSVSGPQSEVPDDGSKNKMTSLFEDNVEFVGVEMEGTQKAMEHALKEGIVGEAGPIKGDANRPQPEVDPRVNDGNGNSMYNDTNYWRSDYNPTVAHDDSL